MNTYPISLVSIHSRPQHQDHYGAAVIADHKLVAVSVYVLREGRRGNHILIWVPFKTAIGDFPSGPPPRGRVMSLTGTRALNPTGRYLVANQISDHRFLTRMVVSECFFNHHLDVFQFMEIRHNW